MEELSLEALQAALISVQEKKATTRLSERNIVELVSKLQELGLLQIGLLHSIQGKEYITPDQLRTEIKEAVDQAGGRLAVADLPAQLGVDLAHCEKQAESVVQNSNGSMHIIQSELMTDAYFDGIAAEVGDLLQDSGAVQIGDMARRFKLGSELMQETIASRLGKAINGRLESGILYTSLYIAKIKAQLRGALRGAVRPVSLSALSKLLDLLTTSSSGKMVQSTVDELIGEGAIFGAVKANTFVPSVYATAQQQAVQDFYAQNGFIEVDMLERLGVQDPSSHMRSAYADSLALEAVFVSPQVLTQLSAAMEEALAAGQWTDALANLPSAISPRDAAALLQKAYPSNAQGRILAGTCLMSDRLLEDLMERSRDVAREAAEAAIQSRKASAKSASTSAPAAASAGPQGESKKASTAVAADSDDEDWDTGKAGSKKKKGGKKKPTAKQKGPPAGSNQSSKSKQGSAAANEFAARLSVEALASRVVEWMPEATGAGEEGSFPEAVAAELRPAAVAEFERAQAAVFLAGAEARRKRRDAISRSADQAGLQYQLFASGADFVKSSETTHTAIQRHLLRTIGQQIADLLLRYHEVELKDGDDASVSSKSEHQQPISAAERSQIISILPGDVASAIASADKALNAADLTSAWNALQEAARTVGLQLRKLDKKTEKGLLQDHKASLAGRLSAEQEPAEALTLAVPLLVAQAAGKAMSVPGKALAGVITCLEGTFPAEQFSQLTEFHKLVVEDLRAQKGQYNPRLTDLLPSLKALARNDSTPGAESAGPDPSL